MHKPLIRPIGRFVTGSTIAIPLTIVAAIVCLQRTAFSQPTLLVQLQEDQVVPSGGPQQSTYLLPSNDFNFTYTNIPGGQDVTGTLSTFAADQQDFYNPTTTQTLYFNIDGLGQINAGDVISVTYNFDFTFTEGTVDSVGIATFDGGHGTSLASVTSGQVISGSFSEPPIATSGNYSLPFDPYPDQLSIPFTRNSVSPTDTLTLTLNSLDVTISQVPEPASASLVFFSALALAQRRRRMSRVAA